jgi:GH35 family endo-1,4-beta-xylanase
MTYPLRSIFAFGLILLVSICPASAEPKGVSLLEADGFDVYAKDVAGERSVVEVKHEAFAEAARVEVASVGKTAYAVEYKAFTTREIAENDVLLLDFWWRAAPETDSEFEAVARVYVSQATAPWTTLMDQGISAKTQWQRVQIPFRARQAMPARGAQVTFHLAYRPQVVDLASIQLINYGPDVDPAVLPRTRQTYAGHEPDAAWRTEALARIERIRKSDLSVKVVDADGKPVEGATVRVRMLRHAFGWGSMINPAPFFGEPVPPLRGNPEKYEPTPEDQRRYREVVEKHFNLMTPGAAMVYNGWLKGEPKQAMEMLRWARQRHMQTRAHFLIQPDMGKNNWFTPLWKNADASTIEQRLREYIDLAVPATTDLVDAWDGINHAGRWQPGTEETISTAFQIEALKRARERDPGIKLFVTENFILSGGDTDEGTRRELLESKIKALQAGGAIIDGIAMQGHFDHRLTSPMKMLEMMDQFGKFANELQVSEFDISITDEKLAADFTRDLLIAVFSHPQMTGFQMWGFWDTDHWKSNSPMYRRDWSLKPSGKVILGLVHSEWRTDVTRTTDASGAVSARAFQGAYQIEVSKAGVVTSIESDIRPGDNRLTVKLP